MQKYIQGLINYTDLYPWYWASTGEKCYSFSVVEAFPLKEGDEIPEPGTELEYAPDGHDQLNVWVGTNGTRMLINRDIANIEEQNGDTVCAFIAAAHAYFMGETIKNIQDS